MIAKATQNGTLKYFLAAIASVGMAVTLGTIVWNASGQAKDIDNNCARVTELDVEIGIMEVEVLGNSKHALLGELKHEHLVEKIEAVGDKVKGVEGRLSDIETSQQSILSAVEDLKKP